jgi:hypothetical protein
MSPVSLNRPARRVPSLGWEPHAAGLSEALRRFETAIDAVEAGDRDRGAALLEAAGALVASDQRAALAAASGAPVLEAARRAFEALDLEPLGAAAVGLLEASRVLPFATGEERAAAEAAIAGALERRDAIEHMLLGAEHIVAPAPDLDAEAAAVLTEFEALVRPELFRLVPLNDTRAAALERIAPAWRERFWWWSDGADLPATCLDHLADAALLIARFPGAEAELTRLVAAQHTIDSAATLPPDLRRQLSASDPSQWVSSSRVIAKGEVKARRGAP